MLALKHEKLQRNKFKKVTLSKYYNEIYTKNSILCKQNHKVHENAQNSNKSLARSPTLAIQQIMGINHKICIPIIRDLEEHVFLVIC